MSIKIKMNKTKKGMEQLRIYLRGESKTGKSTLFRDMILEKYNGDASKGLLCQIGNETGANFLSDLQTTHIDNYKDLIELQKLLITGKGKEHNIEMVCFDTIDEITEIFEKEVCRLSQIETGKPCKTINSAYSGYGMGMEKTKSLMKSYFTKLHRAGFGIFCISHSKVKNIKPKGCNEDESYMVLSSSLSNAYNSVFEDIFDAILTITVERNVVDGKIENTERRLYFRSDGYVMGGCRFNNKVIPQYITINDDSRQFARDFINTLEDAMKNSSSTPLTQEQFKQLQKEEKKQAEKDLKQVQQEVEEQEKEEQQKSVDELKSQLKDKLKTTENKNIVKDYMKEKGVKSVASLDSEQLTEVLAKLQ